MWESGCLTSHSGFIIDSNGNLWHWIHGKENEMKMVQGDNMPFLVSVCANDTLLVALDEYGCVWRTQLNPFIDIKLFRQDNYCDIISIFISPTQNCFYVMDMNGILWKDVGTRKKLVHPGLPPLVSCCINSLSGGIDINGFLWIWKSGKYFEKIRFEKQCVYVTCEKDEYDELVFKVILVDGSVWKYKNGIKEKMFHSLNLPKLQNIKASGKHTLAIDIHGNIWGWGCNSHQELKMMKNSFIPMPVKLTKQSIYKSVYCVKDYSLIIDEEGKVEVWHDYITPLSKVPQAFIRMYRAKSARK